MRFLLLAFCLLLAGPAQAGETRILFQDKFAGISTQLPDGRLKTYPDRSLWAFTFWPGSRWPDSYGDGTNWLDNNGESQTYVTPFLTQVKGRPVPPALRYDPFSIEADGLHIRAALLSPQQQAAYLAGGHRRFGSGLLRSRESFTYGRIRLVAKLPAAPGSWPAFWLLPRAPAWPPEIDVFEGMAWGPHAQQIHLGLVTTSAEKANFGTWTNLGLNPSAAFHEYGLDWTADNITFLFDGRVLATRPTPPSMRQPMYLLINLAVGGKWVCNELGIRPIDSRDPARLSRCADSYAGGLPTEMIVKSVTVREAGP